MKELKRFKLLSILLVCAILLSGCSLKELAELRNKSTEKSSTEKSDGVTSAVLDNVSVTNKDDALNAIKEKADELGISDVEHELTYLNEDDSFGNTFYHFQQMYNDIPVYGRSITVGADDSDNAFIISDNYEPVNVDTTVKIQKEDVGKYIKKIYKNKLSGFLINGLTIYSFSNTAPVLCWEVYVNSENNSEVVFISANSGKTIDKLPLDFYDTVDGNGYDVDGNKCSFNTYTEDNQTFYMKDVDNDITLYDASNGTIKAISAVVDEHDNTYLYEDEYFVDENGNNMSYEVSADRNYIRLVDQSGNVITERGLPALKIAVDKSFQEEGKFNFKKFYKKLFENNWFALVKEVSNKGTEWDNPKAVTVMDRIAKLNNFYYEEFGRSGFDGKNGTIMAVINDSMDGSNNAYSKTWLRITLLSFSTTSSLSYDLIGHEYRHSVTSTVKDGLRYEGESGALDEAYSDIFGELFEDWATDNELDNSCNWHNDFRNLSSPEASAKLLPSYYRGEHWVDTTDTSEGNDRGGVHSNSTVISHAAYLMAEGYENDNTVEVLSCEDLANLFYTTSYVLPYTCSFSEFSEKLYIMANSMYENGKLREKQFLCVAKALKAVGLPITSQSISGTVVEGGSTNAVADANVSFKICDTEIKTVKTDENGKFTAVLPAGKYEVRVEKDGKTAKREVNLKINKRYIVSGEFILGNIMAELPSEFVFSSGAGAWATVLNIEDNGSFSGEYHDAEAGSTGKDYPNGTVYICKFSGKFSPPEPTAISNYVYLTRVESLSTERKPDEVYYEDGIKYICSTPYGIEQGDEFYIYFPGTPSANMANDFLNWTYHNLRQMPADCYGLYNATQNFGFWGCKENSLWNKSYTYEYNGRKITLFPSINNCHINFFDESGPALISLSFYMCDYYNEKTFTVNDMKGSGPYDITLDISDDFSTVTAYISNPRWNSMERWGGTASGELTAVFKAD